MGEMGVRKKRVPCKPLLGHLRLHRRLPMSSATRCHGQPAGRPSRICSHRPHSADWQLCSVHTGWHDERDCQAKCRWYPAALTLILLAVSLLLSAFFYDFSWDGQWYHQLGIITIARDWNPLSDPMRSFAESPSQLHSQLYLRHYAKGPWYAAATIFATTGRIELGKCINWLILMASFLGTLAACLNGGLRRSRALAIASRGRNQPRRHQRTHHLYGGRRDGVVPGPDRRRNHNAPCVNRARQSSLPQWQHPSSASTRSSPASSIYASCSPQWSLVSVRSAPIAATLRVRAAVATLVLGACVWGYNPYVTNTLYRHQPFYPILGSAKYPSLAAAGKRRK